MHKETKPISQLRFWMLDELPIGSEVWINISNHVFGSERFHSRQPVPNAVSLRIIGAGEWVIKTVGIKKVLRSGDIFMAVPGEFIEFYVTEDAPWEWYEIQFFGPGAIAILEAFGCGAKNPARTPDNPTKALKLYKKIHNYMAAEKRSQWLLLAMLFELIDACVSKQTRCESPIPSRELIVNRVIDMIESSPIIRKNVTEMAQELKIDRATLRRAFKEKTGMTPIDFIKKIRLDRARNMLMETDLKVREIAKSTGFASEKYFIRCFRDKFASPPGEWRRVTRS